MDYEISGELYGNGYISGYIFHQITYDVSGSITGFASIDGNVDYIEATAVYGCCRGTSLISSKFNFSRQHSLFPILKRDITYNLGDSPIVAVECVDFNPNKVLNIISQEDSVYENTAEFYLTETIFKNDEYFPITHYPYSSTSADKIDYLVTNYRAQGQNGKVLFYQYELLFDLYSLEDGEILTLYKNNEIKVSKDLYLIESSYDLLENGSNRYSSTTWHSIDPTRTLHRVRVLLPVDFSSREDFYTVSYNKSIYGARTIQTELVELVQLYTSDSDYKITSSGINLSVASKIPTDTSTLYICKNPDDRIKPINIDPASYQPDEISSWRLRVNPGSLLSQSGIYNNQTEHFYYLKNWYIASDEYYAITNARPLLVSEDILRFDQYPIYIDEINYKYPMYTIGTYDKTDLTRSADIGLVSIEVNGKVRTDISIKSIDRSKGYFQLSHALDPTDEIEFNFYVDPTKYMVIENLELNPKVSGGSELYNIKNYKNGIGIALKEYDQSDYHTLYPYLYDLSLPASSRVYYEIAAIGATEVMSYTSGTFLHICDININRLSPDILKITDARRIGGGVAKDKSLDIWFETHPEISIREKESYLGEAYYGGDPQSFGSTVVIHIPSGILYTERDNWIRSLASTMTDPIDQINKGTNDFNYYLDKIIKKYISAGTDYILIPVDASGNFTKIENLSYNYDI